MSARRGTSLSPQRLYLLREWGSSLYRSLGHMPYLVGSVARGEREWRDVDVRMLLPEDEFIALTGNTNPRLRALNLAFTVWGERVTGLPIDFQFQELTIANSEHADGIRNALGFSTLAKEDA